MATKGPRERKGVYAELDDLVRLRHVASGFTFLPRQAITSILSGRHASRLRGRGLNFEEIRGYRPGDDTRNMDWKATARLRKPQVRVYTEERDRPAILVVDQRRSMFFGSRSRMKSVVAAEAAALAAWRVLDQDDRVGAIVFGDEEASFVRPRRSAKSVMHILKEILRFNHALRADRETTENPAAFNAALQRAARAATHDHLVCVISDFAGMDADSERWFTRIAAHNDVIAVGVSDPIGRLLPRAGRLVFSKGGRQLEVDSSARGVQERFRARFDEIHAEIRGFLRRLDVPLLHVTPEGEVIDQVRAQLGQLGGAPVIQEQSDPASLSRLNDVALPPEVSMWPSAPGWWVLAAALLAVVAVLGVVLVRRHRALRYRREALAELRALRAAGDPGRLPALLKRVALCAYPRPEVAALAGEAWSHFLDRTGGVGRFESGAGATLVVVSFGSGPRGSTEELFDAAEAWIEAQGPAR